MLEFFVIFFIAFVVSIISGILGLGGAVILIPAYLYLPQFFGINFLDIKTISGLTSVQVFASSLMGVLIHKKHGSVEKNLLYFIGIPMALSALLGALFSKYVHGDVILLTFALMAIAGAALMLVKRNQNADSINSEKFEFNKTIAFIIAIVVGLFGGMVGAPGAFLLAPLMISVLKIPIRITIGSTLGIILFTSFTASVGKIIAGQVDFLITSYAVLGSLIGVSIGSNLSHKIHPTYLRYALAIVIIGIAIERRHAAGMVFR
ncbi:MAG: sulfite exporter TauE/SafE family protein, partial [Ignavibacteriaceae bacterium]